MTPFERKDMPWIIAIAAAVVFFVLLAAWSSS